MKKPQIMIALAVRDRAWILPQFLKCLRDLEYHHKSIILYFLVNNSTDRTEKILDEFQKEYDEQYKKIILSITSNIPVPKDNRTAAVRTEYIYPHLIKLKNTIREEALHEKVDYLLLLESDVLFPPNLLTSLLSHQKDIIVPLIPVTPKEDKFNIMNKEKGKIWGKIPFYEHILDPMFNLLFKIDMGGGIILIKRKVLQKVKWQFNHIQGEDISFAINCEKENFEIYCDGSIYCQHIMEFNE